MRGKSGLGIFLLGIAMAAATACAAQVQGGRPAGLNVLTTIPGIASQPAPAGNSAAITPAGDLLEFIDGSLMHGKLKQVDASSGITWENPFAKAPIELKPGHINLIRFAHAEPVSMTPTAHLHFVNGDDLFGSVTSLDADHLVFGTWFGQARTIPRAAVQSVGMLSSNFTILYEGFDDGEGWIIGNHNPESWTLQDGVFTGSSSGTLGREFKLTRSSTISFNMAWTQPFELLMGIYCDAIDHMEMGNSYMFAFTPDQIACRRLDSGRQFPVRDMGNAPMPRPAGRDNVRITIQANKLEGTIAVYVDNVLAKRWKDDQGFSASGGGILFQQTGVNGAKVKLSNFEVCEWEGRHEPETSFIATNVDVIRFINHDQAEGKITGISSGEVSLAAAGTVLRIPLQRVTQINFAATAASTAPSEPWEVRAKFPHGGSVSFQLEKWNDREIEGHSAIFGNLAFQPGMIRQLEFNLDKPRPVQNEAGEKDFESLDE